MSQAGAKLDDGTFEDFVNFCRNQICMEKKIPLFDPVWDSYADEQFIIEYFTILFSKDQEALKTFENVLKFGDPKEENPDFEWMEQQVRENAKALKRYNEEMSSEFSLKPEDFVKDKDDGA